MSRREDDAYYTPAWCVRRLLEEVSFPSGKWLEPAAGEGAIIRAVNAFRGGVEWYAIEARAECCGTLLPLLGGKAPRLLCPARVPGASFPYSMIFDVIITNPPYSLIHEYLRWCLDRARVVALLMRLGVLSSEERVEFMRRYPPSLYPLPNRPDYTGDGGDMTDYAWFVWRMTRSGKLAKPEVRVLERTSLEERRNDRPERKAIVERQLGLLPETSNRPPH